MNYGPEAAGQRDPNAATARTGRLEAANNRLNTTIKELAESTGRLGHFIDQILGPQPPDPPSTPNKLEQVEPGAIIDRLEFTAGRLQQASARIARELARLEGV